MSVTRLTELRQAAQDKQSALDTYIKEHPCTGPTGVMNMQSSPYTKMEMDTYSAWVAVQAEAGAIAEANGVPADRKVIVGDSAKLLSMVGAIVEVADHYAFDDGVDVTIGYGRVARVAEPTYRGYDLDTDTYTHEVDSLVVEMSDKTTRTTPEYLLTIVEPSELTERMQAQITEASRVLEWITE